MEPVPWAAPPPELRRRLGLPASLERPPESDRGFAAELSSLSDRAESMRDANLLVRFLRRVGLPWHKQTHGEMGEEGNTSIAAISYSPQAGAWCRHVPIGQVARRHCWIAASQ